MSDALDVRAPGCLNTDKSLLDSQPVTIYVGESKVRSKQTVLALCGRVGTKSCLADRTDI